MNKHFFLLTLLAALLLLAGCSGEHKPAAKIGDFSVSDIPNDEGSGVSLKWQTLDKTQRVIQYNIYRGHNPDSLFYHSKIEVDPDVGVVGGSLSFEDQGFNSLIEFESAPRKLKEEKQQVSSSKLFRGVPRDPELLATLLPHYTVLADISSSKYYNQPRRIEKKSNGKTEVFAGYRLSSFNNVYAAPKTGNPYYYCVVPVTETGKFLPATEVKSAIPVNNRPDSTAIFYSSYLKDTREFRFEWTPPMGGSDIVAWQAWLMPKALLPQFYADQKANTTAPDDVFNASWQSGSVMISEMPTQYWGQVLYAKAGADDANKPIPSVNELPNYIPVLSYMEGGNPETGAPGYQNASLGRDLEISEKALLPKLPNYKVMDKINDKGDNIIVSFGRPFAFVPQATYTNKSHTRLRLNYDITDNGYQAVSKLRFRFFDLKGGKLGEVVESYPDKIIYFRPPAGCDLTQGFDLEISVRLMDEKSFAAEAVTQRINFDPTSLRFNGGDLSDHGQELNSIYYDIFSRNRLSDFSPGMRIGALSRSYDHTIPYPSAENPLIQAIDPKTKLVLTDHSFTIAVDEATGASFTPSLFADETKTQMKELDETIKALQGKIKAGGTEAEEAQLEDLLAEQKFILGNPAYKEGLKAGNNRGWRKAMRAELDHNSRSYAYQLLATDGQGLWQDESDLRPTDATPEKKINFLHPESEWFDTTKLATLLASIIMGIMVVYALLLARRKELYIRPIAGLEELDNAVGRATEMGRPIMFVPGWGTLGEPCTISAMMILNQIAKKTAEYDTRLISPQVDYFVLPLAQEMVQTAYSEIGRPDAFNQNDIYFVSDTQFAFTAAVNGITVREKVATIFYMGFFFAEALLMTETGNQAGAIQIAASDAITQIPFFITTCDYTLIGEEFYAASAYLSRNIELVSMLKAQDYFKLLIVVSVVVGSIISSLGINAFINFLPIE